VGPRLEPWLGLRWRGLSRHRNWCDLWSRYWRSKEADENTNTEGDVGGCARKKEDLDDKAINQDENEAGHRPQSYQEDAGQKAEPESPSNLDCTPDYIQGRTKVVSLTVAARSV
jgi:hypothetical protein